MNKDLLGRTTRHKATDCPLCKKKIDASAPVGEIDAQPKEGDLCCCGYCGAILSFYNTPEGEMTLRSATEEQILQFQRAAPEVFAKLAYLSDAFYRRRAAPLN